MFMENFIQSFVLTIKASPFGNLVATSSLWDILVGFLSFYFFVFLILHWIRVSSDVDFLELKKNVVPLLKDFKSVKDLFFIYSLVTFYVPCFVVRKLDILGPIFFCFCVSFWFSNVNFFDNQIIILCFVYLSTLAGAFSFHYALRDIEIIIDFLSSLFGKDPGSLKTFLVYIFYSSEEEQNPFKVLLVVTYISFFFLRYCLRYSPMFLLI